MKENTNDAARLLSLSKNEQTILTLLDRYNTPVALAGHCIIPRPTIYITLAKLAERGLIKKIKYHKKALWQKISEQKINDLIFKLQKSLMESPDQSDQLSMTRNSHVSIHHGGKDLLNLFSTLIENYRRERMINISGSEAGPAWSKILGSDNIDKINKKTKDVGMINELITTEKFLDLQIKSFGKKWAVNFEGRSLRVQNIEEK